MPTSALFPNQFVNVQLLLRTVEGAVVVPVDGAAARHRTATSSTCSTRPHGDASARCSAASPPDDVVAIAKGLETGERSSPKAATACAKARGCSSRATARRRLGRSAAGVAQRRAQRPRSGAAGARQRRRPRPRRRRLTQRARDEPVAPFILRPVATSLLMVAIVLAGLVGFRFLPLSALPQVDYPTIQVQTLYPGASPEVMAQTVTAPLERQFGQMPGLDADELDQRRRRLDRHAAVRPRPDARRRRAGGAGRDQRRRLAAAGRPAGAAGLRQGQPGRRAGADARHHLRHAAAHRGAEPRQHAARAEDQPGLGRRPGHAVRRPAAGGAHPGRHRRRSASYGLGLDTLRTAITAANANGAKGSIDGPTRAYTINANDQLLDGRRLQQR